MSGTGRADAELLNSRSPYSAGGWCCEERAGAASPISGTGRADAGLLNSRSPYSARGWCCEERAGAASPISGTGRADAGLLIRREETVELERALCFEFKKMHHIIIRAIHERLAACGFDEVTVLHGHILGYLYHNSDRDIYPRDLVKEYEIGKASVTNILQLMEEKGYLTRTPDERDGRLKKIRLTKKGEETHLQTIAAINQLHKDMEYGITKEEREVFFGILDKMRENAAKQRHPGSE